MSKTRIGFAIAVACAVALASTAVFAQGDSAREARDRAEIEALMWRYTRALDSGDGTTYASTYTVDGQFGSGANATKGREALKKMVDSLREGQAAAEAKGEPRRPPMYHMTANSWIEFVDKDHARHHAYYLTVTGAAGQNVPARIVAAGRSVDHLERVNGKWLIKLRDVAPRD
ncbi:MAG: nuclear transport factor 2 family protein [Acidobacteria bacterium]|nr:nuclear transport factor 2 family protein [Acidobacteriota bacterium]